jgi:hypothetical protein
MYIRDTRERTGDEKSAPPRERKTTNKKKTKKNEREREREGGSGRRRLESRGFKIILPFFCCLSVRVFLCGRRVLFRNMSLSINTSTTLLLLLLLIQYYKFILHSTTRLGGPWRIRARRAFHSRTVGSTRPSTIRATARRPRRRPRSTSAKPGRSFRISIGS